MAGIIIVITHTRRGGAPLLGCTAELPTNKPKYGFEVVSSP
jgi:hypothetical protein